ncbi:MAG: flagellar biosynthesis protein FlhF [Gammaproteobacteria bacterium]|nr:flagellar biosynthesis protein FlhF [Gammaproteobacteria bacterium]
MRIKRTFATTMRDALALVKQEQGPDAVILGNKKVPGGVELISAIDYDESTVDHFASSASVPTTPKAETSRQKNDIASNSWAGSAYSDSFDDRKEPVLGPVAEPLPKRKIESARPPEWLERELQRSEQKLRPQAPAKPISKTATVKKTEGRKPEKKISAASSKSAPQNLRQQAQPVIDEVKLELKNLRDLMESQLSVLQWDRFSQSHPVRTVLLNLMSEMGLGTDICEMVFSHLDQLNNDPHKVWQQALGILASCLPMSRRDILAEGGRIALVGSTGVGKTTTIAKLAARFAHTHGKRSVAMISTDHFRIGAEEQLQHFARLLEIPMLTAGNSEELGDRLDMLADKKLVLIDTAGMSQRDLRLSEQFHRLQRNAPQIKPYLVLSANTQLAALNQTIQNFSKARLAGAFVTKLDETASLGGIITVSIRHQLGLTYCGTGQRVPEDMEVAKNHRIISKAVGLMQDYSEQSDQESLALRYNHIINNNQA